MFDGGRKLSVGDCALFRAGNDALPFIGILRKLTQEKDTTKFGVNWLYRPADVKLAKGGPLEAAPNEIFYSFHKDEISAASLLHPCKVAFLRKGIELPAGVSSFVCRRVYDTANKCLWWLTDRDYTDEHQDEVDQLLERTKLEMQAAVQSGGPSPRALSGGPTSSQQLKSSSEAVQNATYSAPGKSKKRERADQSLEPSKRERSVKSEDGELSPLKRERSMKPEEIASITDKDGGLLNTVGVERLVQLMQQDRNDGVRKSTEVASRRTLLANVIAATDCLRDDCLSRFVQLGGLPMLDEWLQEAHKGKVGDGGSPKECDKSVEELLLTLLKALDKLPVDLDALKTCSVGKSVNHLRSHKNVEIQKKARKLVDIWKKRVDAEMKLSGEVKSGSNHAIWSSYKQNSPDMLHSHLMKTGGPTEVAVKSSGAFAGSAKPMPNGTNPGEGTSNAAPLPAAKIGILLTSATSPTMKREENGSNKLASGPLSADVSLSVKEEKSSSVQPQSNGQTWGGGLQGKGAANSTWKEDVKNASMGGAISTKPVGTGSRHPNMPVKGLLGASLTGSSKELLSGKPLVWSRSAVTEKAAASTPGPSEKGSIEALRESSNPQHRLIVRIPNPGRSPARSGGGTFEQGSSGSRVMSPNVPERSPSVTLDTSDIKGRAQTGNLATTSPEASIDVKSGCGGRPVPGFEDERDKFGNAVQSDGVVEGEKRVEESMRLEHERNAKECNEHTGVKGKYSQRNGLSESTMGPEDSKKVEMGTVTTGAAVDGVCSEATAMDVDDLGISLLASVAASEIRRTGAGDTPQEWNQAEANIAELDARVSSDSAPSHMKEGSVNQQTLNDVGDGKEQVESKGTQDVLGSKTVKGRDDASAVQVGESKAGKSCDGDSKKEGLQELLSPSGESDMKDCEKRHFATQEAGRFLEISGGPGASIPSLDRRGDSRRVDENDTEPTALATGSAMTFSKDIKSPVCGSSEGGLIASHDGHNISNRGKKESSDERTVQGTGVELCNGYGSPSCDLKNARTVSELASERLDRSCSARSTGTGEGENDLSRSVSAAGDKKVPVSVSEAVEAALDGAHDLKRRAMDLRAIGRIPSFHSSQILGLPNLVSSTSATGSAHVVKPAVRPLPAGEPTTPEQATETAGPSDGVVGGSDVSERPDFDLNEGFSVEESPQDDSTTSPIASAPLLTASSPGLSTLLAAPIAIVKGTKGGFVLPASPMRTKSELGWKGSAATSAFRPAEPRRTPERQASAADNLAPEVSTGSTAKKGWPPLDLNIDLNVMDDRHFEEVGIAATAAASSLSSQGSEVGMGTPVLPPSICVSGITFQSDPSISGHPLHHVGNSTIRPILDLNMLDESEESGTLLDAEMRPPPGMVPSAKSNNSSSLQASRRAGVVLDFDLNDGPSVEEVAVTDEQPVVQPLMSCNVAPSTMPTGPALRRGTEVVNSSWFAANNSFKAIPDLTSSRAESPYSMAAAVAAQSYFSAGVSGAPFSTDLYRPSVSLSSVPPMAFPSATQTTYHNSYGGLPVATGFPFSTGGAYTASNASPYLDSPVSVNFSTPSTGTPSSHLARPYLIGLSEVPTPESGNNAWPARPSLDLNSGPEPVDGYGVRDDMISRPSSTLGGQPSLDQMRVFKQVVNSAGPGAPPPVKRKEPENGWEMNRSSGFKQQTWH